MLQIIVPWTYTFKKRVYDSLHRSSICDIQPNLINRKVLSTPSQTQCARSVSRKPPCRACKHSCKARVHVQARNCSGFGWLLYVIGLAHVVNASLCANRRVWRIHFAGGCNLQYAAGVCGCAGTGAGALLSVGQVISGHMVHGMVHGMSAEYSISCLFHQCVESKMQNKNRMRSCQDVHVTRAVICFSKTKQTIFGIL